MNIFNNRFVRATTDAFAAANEAAIIDSANNHNANFVSSSFNHGTNGGHAAGFAPSLLPNDSSSNSNKLLLNSAETADKSPSSSAFDPSAFIDASPVESLIRQLVDNGTEFLHLISGNGGGGGGAVDQQPNNNSTSILGNSAPAQTTTDEMILVDGKGIELLPLDELLSMLILALSVSFIVIGGAIPYVFQYAEIYRRKSAAGFSLLVCLALCIANILRIEFWIGKRFEIPLLVQSVIMLIVMVAMLEISVRMNRRVVPITARTSVWNGEFCNAFWKWNDLSSYIFALGLFTVLCSLLNAMFHKNMLFVEAMGMSALLVEACLGVPQLVRNFQRKSTIGMSVKMVLMWFVGDVGKTIYFVVRQSPAQFWICSCLQITIDVLILLQVWAYGQHATGGGAGGGDSHGARIPRYVTSVASSGSINSDKA
ncbi:hypothetical protein niasHT_017542 [Heterodera trifolii]|uniref:Solute carrier family 66 member 2 n=1 Tax=Heterodera trifolii TaxID=157864 RepID=A0ABD2L894_9BILA